MARNVHIRRSVCLLYLRLSVDSIMQFVVSIAIYKSVHVHLCTCLCERARLIRSFLFLFSSSVVAAAAVVAALSFENEFRYYFADSASGKRSSTNE